MAVPPYLRLWSLLALAFASPCSEPASLLSLPATSFLGLPLLTTDLLLFSAPSPAKFCYVNFENGTSKGRVSRGTEKFMFSSPRNRREPNKQVEEASEELTEEDLEHELADITFEDLQRARVDGSHRSHASKLHQQLKPSRANKNRPMEMSSKMRVGRFREVIQAPKKDKQIKSGPRKCAESEILSEHIKKEREAAKRGKRPYYLKKSEIRERKLIQKYNELKAAGKLDSYIEKRQKKNASKDHRYMPYRRSGKDAQE
ncbi:hypothetical protein C4D60_Mb04t38770 [Musa balbisiana]|uniref:rRNA biogenesis protein RRP36 n=1 Tax=Musa balbisiana TaxID=52838 RepID=A0A4S8KIJ7_MUSBA|nr:hypothetical protein C4D60_Mb04t38770 [Musa balbisiana]